MVESLQLYVCLFTSFVSGWNHQEWHRTYCLKFKCQWFFFLISLWRNHKDHVPRIREYYEEVIPRYTDLQLDLQFRHHLRMSRPTVEQLCYCWVIALRFRVNSTISRVDYQFNFENKSLWSGKVSFCALRSLKYEKNV